MNQFSRRISIIVLISLPFSITPRAQVHISDSAAQPRDQLLSKDPSALHFILMGDWGRNGADHQKEVAAQMGRTATQSGVHFVVAAGDNFYPSGVISEWDPLWRHSFEDIYTDFHLQWDWYPILGNHDYKSDPDAQVRYSRISRRWKMPARYYAKKFFINGDTTQAVLMAFIDTNPLIPEFYRNPEYGPNVRTQDSTKQKRWLEKVLSDPSPNIKWRFVIGHHPMYSAGGRSNAYDTRAIRRSLQAILSRYKVDAYLAGHEHNLQHLLPPGVTHHFISGSASEKTPVQTTDISKMTASEYGFMLFSVKAKELLVQAIDAEGKVIYAAAINK